MSEIKGYQAQSDRAIRMVNANKEIEESMLRIIDTLKAMADNNPKDVNGRWLAIGQTHIEQGFMALNRAIFQPSRITLPGDKTG